MTPLDWYNCWPDRYWIETKDGLWSSIPATKGARRSRLALAAFFTRGRARSRRTKQPPHPQED